MECSSFLFSFIFAFLNIRNLPILADIQLKNSFCRLEFPYVPFRTAIRPVLTCKTAHFARRNDSFCNLLNIRCLANTAFSVVINILMLMAARVYWQA